MKRLEKYKRIVEILEAVEHYKSLRIKITRDYNSQLTRQFNNANLKERITAINRLIRILNYKVAELESTICND